MKIDFAKLALRASQDNPQLLPVIEKEILHHDILRAMGQNGFLDKLTFQGGTSLRLCYDSQRYSEDLDFTGGLSFQSLDMARLKECIQDLLSTQYGLKVEVKEPKPVKQDGVQVNSWQVKVVTAPDRPNIPTQKIKIEIANVPSYTREPMPVINRYAMGANAPLVVGVQSLTEIMADKLLAFPAATSHIRYRDIWDLFWMHARGVRADPALVAKKIGDYGVEDYAHKLEARIESAAEIVRSNEFTSQMRRFLGSDQMASIEDPGQRSSMANVVISKLMDARMASGLANPPTPEKASQYAMKSAHGRGAKP